MGWKSEEIRVEGILLAGGKHLNVSQSKAANVERKQEEIFQGGEGSKCSGMNPRMRKGSIFCRDQRT